jgi:hypothetical protein
MAINFTTTAPRRAAPVTRLLAIGLLVAGGVLLPAARAAATERRFGYVYGSGVLIPGDVELESWTTARLGRSTFYDRFDERLELEVGLTERLQTAFYLNFAGLAEDTMGVRVHEFELEGVSSEWKLKLLDPVADPIGLALYWELSAGPTEVELEAKVILDRRFGRFLAALNVVGAYELEFAEVGVLEGEAELEIDAGFGVFITPALFAGLELRNHNAISADGWEYSVLFLGPTFSFAQPTWWMSLSLMPQVGAIAGATEGPFNLADHERLEARLLFGIHL